MSTQMSEAYQHAFERTASDKSPIDAVTVTFAPAFRLRLPHALSRCRVNGLFNIDLSVCPPLHYAGVFQVDQIFLL